MTQNVHWIAHRGFGAIAPENTRVAFETAIALGADGVEFDVQRCGDETLVIFHDATLERTTDGQGELRDRSLAQLQALDLGQWFGAEFTGQRILTLTEALQLFAESTLHLYPEIKATQSWRTEQIQALAQEFEITPWRDRTTLCAFDFDFLQRFQQFAPQLSVAYCISTVEQYECVLPLLVQDSGGAIALSIAADLLLAHPDWLRNARDRAVSVFAWTVNDPELQQQLIAQGVTGLITDAPPRH